MRCQSGKTKMDTTKRYPYRFATWMEIAAGIFFLAHVSGCTSFERMFPPKKEAQTAGIEKQLHQIASSNAAIRQGMKEIDYHLQTLDARIDRLEKDLDKFATRSELYKKLSPPMVVQKPASRSETAAPIKSLPEKARITPDGGKPKQQVKPKKATQPERLSAQGEYERALSAYKEHHYDRALRYFKRFLERYPHHELADNAQYWLGETYYDMKKYPSAISAFKNVVTRYGDRDKAPDALLKIGYAYIALQDIDNARTFLKKVIKDYPFSDAQTKARTKLKELKNL
ncbi:MAG: tol-pal system protein YbgF [Deltaproteobacteria bacterium]|nr:MAG: tol-pal system protein YbgF [Deltaproteobacteria bacterium]